MGSAAARREPRVSCLLLILSTRYGLSLVMVMLRALLKPAVNIPNVLRALACAHVVTNTEPCLPLSVGLKVIVVVIVALVGVMLLMVVATKGTGLKVAVTFFAAFIVTTQEPAPVQSPLQPTKWLPEAGVAVRVTLPVKLPLQVAPQSMPAVELVTVPVPVPDLATVSAALTKWNDCSLPVAIIVPLAPEYADTIVNVSSTTPPTVGE